MNLGQLRRWDTPHAAVRPDLVIVLAPDGDARSGLVQCLEPVVVKALVPELAIEAFDVAVLHGLPGSIRMCRIPWLCAHAMKAQLVNSEPLSVLTADG